MRRALRFAIVVLFVGCTNEAPHVDRCLEGTTPTPDGCRGVPDWNPWRVDASVPDAEAVQADAGRTDAGHFDAGTSTGPPARDGGAPDGGLARTWAMRQVNTQVVNNEFLGEQDVASVNIALVTLEPEGDHVVMTTKICAITSEPYADTTTEFDAAYIGALAPTRSELTLTSSRFEPTPRIQLVGWRADDASTEALPESESDARVFDADGDEAPGATLHVRGSVSGELYIVQRTTTALTGRFVLPDRIEGTSVTSIERTAIGASNELLRAGHTTHRAHADPGRSPFELVRIIDGGTCDDARAQF